MSKEELKQVISGLTPDEIDCIESIIINANQAKTYNANRDKLKDLGLIRPVQKRIAISKDFDSVVPWGVLYWMYAAGPISQFFEITATLD